MSRISGRKVYECPIYRDCPFTGTEGQCRVYGYDLRVMKDSYVKSCPEYDWRLTKRVPHNEWRTDGRYKAVKLLYLVNK